MERQSEAVRETAQCARARGGRFWFVHDFLAWDLDAGRLDQRKQMLEARRASVEQAGGTFFDLYEEFKSSAGVSWFNDFIHPSAIGHRRIADWLCPRVTR
jgi:hypothetical protein